MRRFVLPITGFCLLVLASCAAPASLQQPEKSFGTTQSSPIVQSQQQTNQPDNKQSEANPQNDNTYIYQTPGGVKKQIVFRRGQTSAMVKGRVVRMDRDIYTVSAREGQKMAVSITSIENNAAFDLRSPDDTSLCGTSFVKQWSGKLPATGNYTIEVGPERGNTTYKLNVSIKQVNNNAS